MGAFSNGEFDTLARSGDNVITTLDIKLQEYGEKLMKNKKGSIVAIEPETGEILALISSPGYDPNLLCGAVRSDNYRALLTDRMLPLYIAPTLATYPPGSSFKPVNGLIALQEKVQGINYTVPATACIFLPGFRFTVRIITPVALLYKQRWKQSCNPYFWQTFRNAIENKSYPRIQDSYGKWVQYCNSFGLGIKTGVDLPSEVSGNIPTVHYFNKMYGENGWHSATIISLGIGQGEILVTPIQLANLYACIGNSGYYITPHVVKKITDPETGKDVTHKYERHQCLIDQEHFVPVIEGLHDGS